MLLLACLLVLGSISPCFHSPETHPQNGVAHSGLDLPTAINNEDNFPIGQPVLDKPSLRLSS